MNSKWFLVILAIILMSPPQAVANNAQARPKPQLQEVKFDGARVKLAGTLSTPQLEGGKKAPAVVIIPDSGATTREGATFGSAKHPIYRELAEHFASKGIATLRYDRRCSGESECKPAESFEDYIDDAAGAVNFLRMQGQIDSNKIFIFGHGEGAHVATSLSTHEENKIAGLAVVGMAGRTHNKILRDRLQRSLTESGKSAQEVDSYTAKFDLIAKTMMSGQPDAAEFKLDPKNKFDAMLIDMLKQRQVMVSLMINDPLQIVKSVRAPILIVQGGKDVQVSVKDAHFLEEALKRYYHQDVTMRVFDDLDHLLKVNKGAASFASLEDASRPIDPTALSFISGWVEQKVKGPKGAEKAKEAKGVE